MITCKFCGLENIEGAANSWKSHIRIVYIHRKSINQQERIIKTIHVCPECRKKHTILELYTNIWMGGYTMSLDLKDFKLLTEIKYILKEILREVKKTNK